MQILKGKSVFGGVAIGKISVYQKQEQKIKRYKIEDAQAEWQRYQAAKETAITQLQVLFERALKEVGEANATIFEVHQMMLEDDDYNESVENLITMQKVNAEYAVAVTGENFSKIFESMDDPYMKERSADVKDISERVISNLSGNNMDYDYQDPVILVANDLVPSETVQMDKSKIIAFVTKSGSTNSHTAILAKTMAIPAIVNTVELNLNSDMQGKLGIVDGYTGTIYIEPDDDTLEKMKKKQAKDQQKKELLLMLKGKGTITKQGKKIKLFANIGNIKDLGLVIENDAEGIGLFRSEFIFLESRDYPTEEAQFKIYKDVAQTMGNKPVIIRTLDIGADKQCDYFQLDHEENPALGYRGIRVCLSQPNLFKTQLRAIFRAAIYGNISIMYPMITSVQEIKSIQGIVEEIKEELKGQGIDFKIPKQGIMIETPAAVMISDELAKEADFFSIGTNDLTQYTLAIDRQNPKLEAFYDPYHPAILKMIQQVIQNGHKEGIWVGICGELGADFNMTKQFLDMGIDELSVSPGSVLPIRKIIRDH